MRWWFSLLSGALFGLIPLFKYAGPQTAAAIRQGGRTLSQSRERHRAVLRMQHAILDRIAQWPGVVSAGFASGVTMDGNGSFDPVFAEDHPRRKASCLLSGATSSPLGFLKAIGNPVLAGRDYTWNDLYSMAPVAIVTENMAREY